MNIAIIGAGNVGGALGRRWAEVGHSITYGVRDPNSERVRTLLAEIGSRARAVSIQDAAQSNEIIALAVPWGGAAEAVQAAGNLTGKILIDCTNPLAPDRSLAIGHTTSAGEQVAAWATGAKVVKAFNTTGSRNMLNTDFGAEQPSMFLCGDDSDAKQVVGRLAEEIGFDPVDCGGISIARYLEPLAALWIHLAYGQRMGGDRIAFRIIRR